MSTGLASRVIRAPGRIIIGPTDLTSPTTDYGGTAVGRAKLCNVTPMGAPFRVESEALGEATDVLEGNNRWLFNCFLRGWDDDGVELLLSGGFEAGAASQHATFHAPGNRTPGQSAYDRGVVLLYVPDDVVYVPAVLIYHGIPDFPDGAEMMLQRREEFGVSLAVECLRDANANILRIGRLADLSLT